MNFAKIDIVPKKEIPSHNGSKIDYTPLLRKVALMQDDERVKLPVEKAHHISNIQHALDKEFKHAKYKAFQRTIDGQLNCIIKKL